MRDELGDETVERQHIDEGVVVEQVRRLLLSLLHGQLPADDEDIIEAGLIDSLGLIELLVGVEREFGVELELEELELGDFRSIRALSRTVINAARDKGLTESPESPGSGDGWAPPRVFRSLVDQHEIQSFAESALPWVHDAGRPYFDWFFGDEHAAQRVLADWMLRPSSEVYAGRVTTLFEQGGQVGGLIALPGADLETCRQADAIAAIKDAGRSGLAGLEDRMREGRRLFAPVGSEDFYLSKIGVLPGRRGKGHGRALMDQFFAEGLALGFRRFRVDVSAANDVALHIYRRLGFETVAETSSTAAGMTYLSLALEK